MSHELIKDRWYLPLSFAQQRIWFLDQFIGNKRLYNVPVVLGLQGDIQIQILEQAMNLLIDQHDILRSRITSNNQELVQEILPQQEIKLKITFKDLSQSHHQLDTFIEQVLHEPFDLSQCPLMRASLFKVKESEYILCFVCHHIITDAHSLDILFNELAQTYNSIKLKVPLSIINKKSTYHDYVRWQYQQLENKQWDTQVDYWKSELKDATYLELPKDYPRKEKQSYIGNHLYAQIDNALLKKIKSIARAEQVTLFMVLLSIFQIALYRFTGTEDIIVGIPVSCRNHLNLSNTLGLFVNTLAIRLQINKNLSFIELLKKMSQVVLPAYQNQDLPFEKVLESLCLKRSNNKHPIVPVMYSHRQKRVLSSPFIDVKTEFLDYLLPTSPFDLTLITEESDDKLSVCIEYASDLFSKESMTTFLDYFKRLIMEVADNQHHKIKDLIRCQEDYENKLLVQWNNTQNPFTNNLTIQEYFEEQVLNHPLAIALDYENTELTYLELDQLSNQLAHILRKDYTICPEQIVGIYMEPSQYYLISIWAILKAGGAYLPLDPNYPAARLQWMIEDAKPSLILSSVSAPELKSPWSPSIIKLDDPFWIEKMALSSSKALENRNKPSHLAYVIYTSGSTGKPKGVMIEHKSVMNLIEVQEQRLQLSKSSKVLQFSSMSFDASIWEWTMALHQGSTLYLIPTNIRRDPTKLIEHCNNKQITHLTLPPSMLALLPENSLPHLQVLILAGEVSSGALLKKWQAQVPLLINAYGLTETTVLASMHPYDGNSPEIIGRPIANTQFYILDDSCNNVPIGMPGELYIGGSSLVRGYLNREELTKERFIMTAMGKLYKTGDLARFQSTGLVVFLGRVDNQVKIRGHRLELNEIENQINQHQAVQQSVVIMKDNQKLIAYIALQHHATLSEEATKGVLTSIRAHLENQLPSYMWPNGFVLLQLEQFAFLPNGKIDRNSLAQQSHPIVQSCDKHRASLDSIEFALAKIWKEILHVSQISVDDDFFRSGGNSLLSVSLVEKIKATWDYPLSLDEFYSNPTIAMMSTLLKTRLHQPLMIHDQDALYSKCVLPIQTKGAKLPIFMIHPSLGLALPYMGLRRYLFDQPIYGLSNPYFGKTNQRFKSIFDMASFYVEVIQKIQSSGPIILAGWSFGGVVALEMARLLTLKNKPVEHVILLDSYHPKLILEEPANAIHGLLLQYKISLSSEEAGLIQEEIKHHAGLLQSFHFNGYKGRVTIIKAQKTMHQYPLNGWEEDISPKPNCHYVSCTHETLFDEDFLEQTCRSIKTTLLESERL